MRTSTVDYRKLILANRLYISFVISFNTLSVLSIQLYGRTIVLSYVCSGLYTVSVLHYSPVWIVSFTYSHSIFPAPYIIDDTACFPKYFFSCQYCF